MTVHQFTEGDKIGRGADIAKLLNAVPSYALPEPSLAVRLRLRGFRLHVLTVEQPVSAPVVGYHSSRFSFVSLIQRWLNKSRRKIVSVQQSVGKIPHV